jgi:PAS domain S-box-containing protein
MPHRMGCVMIMQRTAAKITRWLQRYNGHQHATHAVTRADKLHRTLNALQEKDQRLLDDNTALHSHRDQRKPSLHQTKVQADDIDAQRRRSEAIIESMGEGVMVIGKDMCIESINTRSKEIFGSAPDQAIPDAYQKRFVRQCWEELHASCGRIVKKEIHIQQPKACDLLVTLTRIGDAADEHAGFVAVLRDVTMQKEVERMKSDFVANVAHEIRAPMAPLHDALELVLDGTAGPLTDNQQRFLTLASHNMDRLVRLINDLLDLAKIESGKMELQTHPVNMQPLIQLCVDTIHVTAMKKHITVSTCIQDDVPIVTCDEDWVTQVLMNLLTNAIKFTPDGGTIVIRASRMDAEGADAPWQPERLMIQVEDSGPGLSDQQAEALFNRFKQIAGPEQIKGTGLGLAIAKSIVEMHEGKIWVESALGHGASFNVTLPIKPCEQTGEDHSGTMH